MKWNNKWQCRNSYSQISEIAECVCARFKRNFSQITNEKHVHTKLQRRQRRDEEKKEQFTELVHGTRNKNNKKKHTFILAYTRTLFFRAWIKLAFIFVFFSSFFFSFLFSRFWFFFFFHGPPSLSCNECSVLFLLFVVSIHRLFVVVRTHTYNVLGRV